jgi:Fic family protein
MTQLALTFADRKRLGKQLCLVKGVVVGAGWMTLAHIEALTGAPQASISARLRELRSLGYLVERRAVPGGNGLHEYAVSP